MQNLETVEALEDVWAASEGTPQFVFKHSTVCPVSARARAEVEAFIEKCGEDEAPVHMIQVIEARPVSNAVAETLGVKHESPQLILVKGREAVWHASHGRIKRDAIKEALSAPEGS
ncbi:MAG TPA: bacillithiol system redox-active protein YtxJ [Candidatus Hydrogenedentes bacterium]|nr:bacillithiol system redox-active protein YtxJ [Candidatus Hydrogenedentota bacterium]